MIGNVLPLFPVRWHERSPLRPMLDSIGNSGLLCAVLKYIILTIPSVNQAVSSFYPFSWDTRIGI